MNPKKEDDKCFQCAVTVALYFEKTESHREIVSNIILFINKYNLEGINYPSKIDDCKTFEKSNPTNCSQYFVYQTKRNMSIFYNRYSRLF